MAGFRVRYIRVGAGRDNVEKSDLFPDRDAAIRWAFAQESGNGWTIEGIEDQDGKLVLDGPAYDRTSKPE